MGASVRMGPWVNAGESAGRWGIVCLSCEKTRCRNIQGGRTRVTLGRVLQRRSRVGGAVGARGRVGGWMGEGGYT